ncbi:MAG: hypothetical protein ACHQIO_19795, partial [Nevskiales bacterium]
MKSEVATGRRMKMRDGFIRCDLVIWMRLREQVRQVRRLSHRYLPPLAAASAAGARPSLGLRRIFTDSLYLGALAQLVRAVHHDQFSRRQAR